MRRLLPVTFIGLVACGPAGARPDFEATGAFIYAPLTPAQGAGYLVLHNRSASADTLEAVSVDWARHTTIHQTTEEGGMVRMSHLSEVTIPARDSVVLAPGGIHLMFMDLSRMPVAGDSVVLLLRLRRAGTVEARAEVRPYGQE